MRRLLGSVRSPSSIARSQPESEALDVEQKGLDAVR